MAIFSSYAPVRSTEDLDAVPLSVADEEALPPSRRQPFYKTLGRRSRTLWIPIALFLIALVLFFAFVGGRHEQVWKYAGKFKPASWTHHLPFPSHSTSSATAGGRTNLSYWAPFNENDLTFTEDECDAFFPGLWKDIDRSVDYYTKNPFTREYLDKSCDDPDWTHARVVIHNNTVYLKYYKPSDFTRSQAALAFLYLSVMTSRERLPDVEFCMGLQDWGRNGKFGLDRESDQQDVWLMPDYAWFSWPEHVGSYTQLRENMQRVEDEVGWKGKHNQLLWRGSMAVGTADRDALVAAAHGYEWDNVQGIDWGSPVNTISMEDHCRWKFHAVPDGNTYTGRLRYLQNCHSVIITHEPRWIEHFTHLFNADWDSPEQNIVLLPKTWGNPWEHLPEVMDVLLKNDDKAKSIADNQWNFFRKRYITPASGTCYWRKVINGFAKVQRYDVALDGSETSYESFLLMGMRGNHH